ncbi:hypothetical protein [Candidatus Endomicrobiellum agilis]|uniref:hypothetical protein n=1 Tax=Candidatus Endomicrobiellum agilis TaxID=3238957 RepID=UPI00357A6D06|nr:hypothetical protein [Endomicrobium sp.]
MKKIISVCLCICLMSGCDKPLRHGRPVNAVVEDKGSEGVPTHSLTSDTSALAPSNTPAPTPEPSKSASPASGNVDTGSSVVKYGLWAFAVILSVIAVCGVYKPLYRFASIKKPIYALSNLKVVSPSDIKLGCLMCYPNDGHFFDRCTNEYIDAIPVDLYSPSVDEYRFYYQPDSPKLKLLKTWLRKIFGIEVPKSPYKAYPYR